jgi:hypothetical protein
MQNCHHCFVCPFLLAIGLFVLFSWPLVCLSFSLGHLFDCPFLLGEKDRQTNGQENRTDKTMTKRKGQTHQWPGEKDRHTNGQEKSTDKPMAKRKGQSNQWPREKDRQTNGQEKRTNKPMAKRKGQTNQWPREKDSLKDENQTGKITRVNFDYSVVRPYSFSICLNLFNLLLILYVSGFVSY